MYIDLGEFKAPSRADKIEYPNYIIHYFADNGLRKTKKFDGASGYDFLIFYYKLKAKRNRIITCQLYSFPPTIECSFIEYKGYILSYNIKIPL